MHSRKSALASAIAIGATALAFSMPTAQAAPAAAKTQKVKSHVAITNVKVGDGERVSFIGKVTSKKPVCTKRRVVKVRSITQDRLVGKDRTNKAGKFKISFNGTVIKPGKFKVTVAKKVVRKGGKRIICKAAARTQDLS